METSSNEISALISNPLSEERKFNITLKDIVSLIQTSMGGSASEALDKIQKMGGESFLEKALNTNFEKGLVSKKSDFQEREILFGNNRKPEKKI